jgi:hypothetical protein
MTCNIASAVAVYDGRDCIGFVKQVAPQNFRATDIGGRVLGLFTDRAAAIGSLTSAIVTSGRPETKT